MDQTEDAQERTRKLIQKAVGLLGSEAKLGKAVGRSQNAVWQAKVRGSVTAEMAIGIDRATGGAVSKEALRPDLFAGETMRPGSEAA